MNKKTALIKNTMIIGIGSLSTKILTILLLPLYTALLSTDDYGTIDVLLTVSSLVIPFATLEMSSGVFRFIIGEEKKGKVQGIISTGLMAEVVGLCICSMGIIILNSFYTIPYCYVFIFYFVSISLLKLASDTARGLGNNIIYSSANFIVTLISLLLNLLFILIFNMKGESILIAATVGNICGIILIVLGGQLWKFISVKLISSETLSEIVRFTFPLIPNTVSWWVVSASDRLLILLFLGTSSNGIYAVANKIPGIYTTIFSVFCLAWTEAVARNTNDIEFVNNTFKNSIRIMIYMLLGIIACSSLFFDILIGKNYCESYWHVFVLLLAVFFSAGSSLLGGIFVGKMESKTVAQTTLLGAIVNILINGLLIRTMGLYAASISTLVAYFFVFTIRLMKCRQWYKLKIFCIKDISIIYLLVITCIGYVMRMKLLNLISIVLIVAVFIFGNKDIVKKILKNKSEKKIFL